MSVRVPVSVSAARIATLRLDRLFRTWEGPRGAWKADPRCHRGHFHDQVGGMALTYRAATMPAIGP